MPRKIGFVAAFSNAAVHRMIRGALSYADLYPPLILRDFRVSFEIAKRNKAAAELAALNRWRPDGLLTHLDDREFDGLMEGLEVVPPIVNIGPISPRPGVVLFGGCFHRMVEAAAQHFRQQGIRSLGYLYLDRNPEVLKIFTRAFHEAARPPNPEGAVYAEPIDPEFLSDLDAPVEPVPEGLARWLLGLPKPAGVMSAHHGGGNYLVRVCHALGLRVPEDVAVIGGDDMDFCLSSRPTLTSVQFANEIIGSEALKVLDGMIQGRMPEKPAMAVEAVDLHVRQSTGLKAASICDLSGALNYIDRHACNGLSVEQLLDETQQVSKMTFYKHFEAATGLTPGQAIRQRQIAEARRLLTQTKLSITLVAEQSGFGSSSDFARAFRIAVGMTPGRYRGEAARS
ncbi:substrate-binding domain-containing protein [Luteolibacter luteus]|uniref:Helix-turn-helix domain-containing protein n=1 Tax=Luteolibacter luteus TaxID=2728835 RepID=A0A858RCI4_9BACT|nr:substrate-binding domain-containing protein [Luteolibacter luteus]QJE94361.1 helix-turn-helix domain-containing protein [Luteolibacter luteus]